MQKKQKISKVEAKEYLSISEACHLFSVSRWTIRRAITKYKIAEHKEGRLTLVGLLELHRAFAPIYHHGKRMFVSIEYNDIPLSKYFDQCDIDKQMEWIEKHKRKFTANQRLFDAGKANDWGKFKYIATPC